MLEFKGEEKNKRSSNVSNVVLSIKIICKSDQNFLRTSLSVNKEDAYCLIFTN